MATIDLGRIKFKWQGAYNAATAYVVDDVVESGGNSYVCIAATTGNTPPNATYWELMAQKGVDADLFSISGTVQGDIYYNNGSAIARLAPGTSGQALITNGASANPSWGTISSGTYSVHRIDTYSYSTEVANTSASTDYIDISAGNTVNFTPTSTDDFVFFSHSCNVNWPNGSPEGADVYLMMKAGSSAIGSGDTKLNYSGQHANYTNNLTDYYTIISKQIMVPCTSLTVGTTYYVEQAGANHNGNLITFNKSASNNSGFVTGMQKHHVTMTHYKKN